MLKQLHKIMINGDLPALSYHFAEYVYNKSANDSVALAAALLSWQNTLGHVCISLQSYAESEVIFKKGEHSEITAPSLQSWISALEAHPWVSNTFPSPMILEKSHLYLGKYWKFETQLASTINTRLGNPINVDIPLLSSDLQRLFPKVNNAIDWQGVAAAIALLNQFVVISGGPGTGKTSTVIRILVLLLSQNPEMKIEMVAPTGKAAARLSESIRKGKQDERLGTLTPNERKLIPENAKTIHRLLKYSPRGFRHNAKNLIPVDTLVIDEASMVDLPLMTRLLSAISTNTHVILLGDRDQLSSVEAGSVLGDITGHGQEIQYNSDLIQQLEKVNIIDKNSISAPKDNSPPISQCVSLLHKSYRFNDHSGIGLSAKLINKGKGQEALQDILLSEAYTDANWISSGGETINSACIKWASKHYRNYLEKKNIDDALQAFEQVRVLTALRSGFFGMDTLNDLIIAELSYLKLIDQADEFHGKPIMITCNDYELDLFNGDIGLLWKEEKSQQLYAFFPNNDAKSRRVAIRQLPQHETAFAMTIHKSQGSEFDNLLMVLPSELSPVVTKELIYTGITRAKKHVLLAGNEDVFIQSCRKTVQRSSGLAEKLGWTTKI